MSKSTPHHYRRQGIHAVLLCLILIIALLSSRCATIRKAKDPCKERRGMSGYGYGFCPSIQELRKDKKTAYLYCINTGIVGVWDAQGKLSCIYHVSK